MSIKTTVYITREQAIDRIKEIRVLKDSFDYNTIDQSTFESYDDVERFVKTWDEDISHIENWTNTMLESLIDKSFYRWSMFDNYIIGIEPSLESWL